MSWPGWESIGFVSAETPLTYQVPSPIIGVWFEPTLLTSPGILRPSGGFVYGVASQRVRTAGNTIQATLTETHLFSVAFLDNFYAPLTYAPCAVELLVYDDDRTTVLWAVGTDAGHALPLLAEPSFYAEQEIDPATGGVSIGTVSVTLIDPATVPGDQDSGWMTARLAYAGVPDIAGRRCRLLRYVDTLTPPVVIADGPAGAPILHGSYAGFTFAIRDTRELERRVRAFDVVERALIPDEHIPPYGGKDSPPFPSYITPGLRPIPGQVTRASGFPSPSYMEVAVGASLFPFTGRRRLIWQDTHDALTRSLGRTARQSSGDAGVGAAWQATALALDVPGGRITNPRFSFHWRPLGDTGAYTVIPGEFLAVSLSTAASTVTEGARILGRVVVEDLRLNPTLATYDAGAAAFPTTGTDIEFYLLGIVPPDERHYLPIEDVEAGAFVRDLYDGVYSDRDPLTNAIVPSGIRYDATALAQMTDRIRIRIREPWADLRQELESLVYGPTGWIPALDNDGRVSPVSRTPPTTRTGLVAITDAVAEPAPDWGAGSTMINVVRFTYPREFYLSHYDLPSILPTFEHRQAIIGQRQVTIEWQDIGSVARHGPQVLELDGSAFAATGQVVLTDTDEALIEATPQDRYRGRPRQRGGRRGELAVDNKVTAGEDLEIQTGNPVVPWPSLTLEGELGWQLGERARTTLLPRYAFGAPIFTVRVRRSVSATLRAGSWVAVDLSWLPDYATGRRGLIALGQITALGDLDCAWRQITIEVAGALPPS